MEYIGSWCDSCRRSWYCDYATRINSGWNGWKRYIGNLIQDRYNSNWLDMHTGALSNQSHYNDTGGGNGAASVPTTSYFHFTGYASLYVFIQDSMTRQRINI